MRSNLLFEPYPGIKDQTCSKVRFKAKRTLARKFLPNSEDVSFLQRTHPDAINCGNVWTSHSYRWRWTAMAIFSLRGLSSRSRVLYLWGMPCGEKLFTNSTPRCVSIVSILPLVHLFCEPIIFLIHWHLMGPLSNSQRVWIQALGG